MEARSVIGEIGTQTNQPVAGKSGDGLINIVLRVQELLLGLGFISWCLFDHIFSDSNFFFT
jgi:hypothetical protein